MRAQAQWRGAATPFPCGPFAHLHKCRRCAQDRGHGGLEPVHQKDGGVTVDEGALLGATKRITAEGVKDIRNQMAAYTVVQAESHDAAAKMFLNHPHLTIFRGWRRGDGVLADARNAE